MSDRLTAFVLFADRVAMNARAGRCTVRDRLALAQAALEWVRSEDALCDVVVDFLDTVGLDEARAGYALGAALDRWRGGRPSTLPETLARLEAEAVAEGWTGRKDCGHG